MTHDGIAKVQHYVPQFLLRNFGTGKKNKLHVFDKLMEKAFATNSKNVAAESRFYDFELGGNIFTIEHELSRVEGQTKPIIKSILEMDSLAHLTAENRAQLSVFMAIQFTRSKWFREQYREFPKLLENAIRDKSNEDADLSAIAEYIQTPNENDLAILSVRSIMSAAEDYAIHFANKIWILGATDSKHPFLIGDNPVGLQNMIDMGLRGNLGLAVRGIEIYLPLSPKRILTMFCSSYEQIFRSGAMQYGPTSEAHQLWQGIGSGAPVIYRPENVLNVNAMQVRYAERFVFSSTDDHSLVRGMISENERYKKGARSVVI